MGFMARQAYATLLPYLVPFRPATHLHLHLLQLPYHQRRQLFYLLFALTLLQILARQRTLPMIPAILLHSNYKLKLNLLLFIPTEEEKILEGLRLPQRATQVLTQSVYVATAFKKAILTVAKFAITHTPTLRISIGIMLQLT